MKQDAKADAIDLKSKLVRLQASWKRTPNPSYKTRLDRLARLYAAIKDNEERLINAMVADFSNRSRTECKAFDFSIALHEIVHLKRHLRKWMRPRRASVPLHLQPARARIIPQPLGVVGVISPWNFPIFLSVPPLAAALAAGNQAMLKPSELSPRTSEVLKDVLEAAFSADELVVVTGGPAIGAEFASLPFDHLVFTGSTAVGRKVAQSAAPNLTPVTLELGGKSPAIVTPSADLDVAAERIIFGKTGNAGQMCVAPDYALVPREKLNLFVSKLEGVMKAFYPAGTASNEYTAIISDRHKARLDAMIAQAKSLGGETKTIQLDDNETNPSIRKVVPTIVVNPDLSQPIMQEEIFGPILPVIAYDTQEEALSFVQEEDRPLALYIFGTQRSDIRFWLKHSISGGVCVNEVALHLLTPNLPFGGVGASGMGSYHGKHGFDQLSHLKAVFTQTKLNGVFVFSPPVTGLKKKIASVATRLMEGRMPKPGPKPDLVDPVQDDLP
ncbi:MAG: coniferyl aldehyde dehydrogenase [Pseudomonadota bacterium]